MEVLKRIATVLLFLGIFLLGANERVFAVSCGQVSRKNILESQCKPDAPIYCNPSSNRDITYNCFINDENKCVFNYAWEGCASHYYANGDLYCEYLQNTVVTDCTPEGAGGDGGGYNNGMALTEGA